MRERLRRMRGASDELVEAARSMRHSSTAAEALLWRRLRSRNVAGLRFRRQHPVGHFVLDFYCAELKLAIELDGPIHNTVSEHDAARTAVLTAAGYTVLRFRNEDVLGRPARVLRRIERAAGKLRAIRDAG